MTNEVLLVCNKRECHAQFRVPWPESDEPQIATCPECGGNQYYRYFGKNAEEDNEYWGGSKPLEERVGPIRIQTVIDDDGRIIQHEENEITKSFSELICDVKDRQLETKLAELGFVHNGECHWFHEPEYWYWETDCGQTHESVSLSGPLLNGYKFCPYCGGRLVSRERDKEEIDES